MHTSSKYMILTDGQFETEDIATKTLLQSITAIVQLGLHAELQSNTGMFGSGLNSTSAVTGGGHG